MSGPSDGDTPDKTGSIADTESWFNPGRAEMSSSDNSASEGSDESLSESGSATLQGRQVITVTTRLKGGSTESGHGVTKSTDEELLQVPESARRFRVRNMSTPSKENRSFIRGRLIVTSEEDRGVYVYLDGPLLTIGRGRDTDIMILDEGASRLHARLVRHDEGFRIVDAESGNGTYLNGRNIKEAELYDGDVIGIGQTRLEYESLGWQRRLVDRPSVVQAVLIGQPASDEERPLLWPKMLISALTAFLTMMVFTLLDTPNATDSVALANSWHTRAQESVKASRWDDARDELEIARVLGLPEARYSTMVEVVETNMRDLELARMIETSIVSGQPIATIQTLASRIDPKGTHAAPVETRVRQAIKDRTDRWLRDARRSLAAGDEDSARIILNKVIEVRPKFTEAQTLLKRLNPVNSPKLPAR